MKQVPQRFSAWAASAVFATVCLASHASRDRWDSDDEGKWIFANFICSIVFSCLGVLAHIVMRDMFVGKITEGLVSFLLVVLWCTGLPFVMDPDNNIAISGSFGSPFIINPNLFFFSWAGFACAFYIFAQYVQEATARNLTSNVSPKNTKWGGLLATCVVVVSAASQTHVDAKCVDRNDDFCDRNTYAIVLGAAGIILPLIVLLVSHMGKLTGMMELAASVIMLILTTCGVAFLTFGSGSATQMSNLYFSVWIAFGISVFLWGECFAEFMAPANETKEYASGDVEEGEEKQVEKAQEEEPKEIFAEVKEQPIRSSNENLAEATEEMVEA